MSNGKDLIPIEELGYNIKERRLEKGLSQAKVATYCEVSEVCVQKWEKGSTRKLAPRSFEKLRELLG